MLQGLTAAHLRRVVEKAYRRHGLRLAFAGLYCCAQKKIAAAQVRLQPQYAYHLLLFPNKEQQIQAYFEVRSNVKCAL